MQPKIKMRLVLLSVALLGLIAGTAHAAIVDVQGRIDADERQGWRTLLSFSGNKRTGNTALLALSGSARLQYREKDHLACLTGAYFFRSPVLCWGTK